MRMIVLNSGRVLEGTEIPAGIRCRKLEITIADDRPKIRRSAYDQEQDSSDEKRLERVDREYPKVSQLIAPTTRTK